MEAITGHLLSVVSLGTKLRLYSGACLSIFDMVSDVYMTTVFLGDPATKGVAYANIACVALSLVVQLLVAWVVHRRRGWRKVAREMLYVVMYIKPGIDAARVAAGDDRVDDNAQFELTIDKVVEMGCEAIPSTIIQSRAFIISEKKSPVALASIIMGCCTTGFAAATIFYDMGTSAFSAEGERSQHANG
jgi:hypothetical protein